MRNMIKRMLIALWYTGKKPLPPIMRTGALEFAQYQKPYKSRLERGLH
jgi:hypothetical protein